MSADPAFKADFDQAYQAVTRMGPTVVELRLC
jgi:hypothetical protein